jgi:ribosomal protein S8
MLYGYKTNFPFGENIARLNYAILRRKSFCDLQFTALTLDLCRFLVQLGYFAQVQGEFPSVDRLRVYFRFVENRNIVSSMRVVSRPGRRYYATRAVIQRRFKGTVAVVSTSSGLKASTDRVIPGGEVVCLVYS